MVLSLKKINNDSVKTQGGKPTHQISIKVCFILCASLIFNANFIIIYVKKGDLFPQAIIEKQEKRRIHDHERVWNKIRF